jgi:hypothetical protein
MGWPWAKIAHAPAKNRAGHYPEKFFERRTSQHAAPVRIEQQESVFQPRHHLIQIFAESAEDFADVTQLLSDVADLRANQA